MKTTRRIRGGDRASRYSRLGLESILGAVLLAVLAVAPQARSESIALTGATVHTVSGPVIENANVIIENGKITAVGRDARPPAGATVVSCTG